MIQLELNQEEKNIMVSVLESYLSDLTMEIADTDLKDFRDGLKHRREVIQKVIAAFR